MSLRVASVAKQTEAISKRKRIASGLLRSSQLLCAWLAMTWLSLFMSDYLTRKMRDCNPRKTSAELKDLLVSKRVLLLTAIASEAKQSQCFEIASSLLRTLATALRLARNDKYLTGHDITH